MPLGPPGRGPASSCSCGRLQMAPQRCQGLLPWVPEWVCCQSDFIAAASWCCIQVNRLKEAQSKEHCLAQHVCKTVRVRSCHDVPLFPSEHVQGCSSKRTVTLPGTVTGLSVSFPQPHSGDHHHLLGPFHQAQVVVWWQWWFLGRSPNHASLCVVLPLTPG